MTDLRLRARTVSELVDAAFALYRRHGPQYIVVSALAIAPLLVIQLVVPNGGRPVPGAPISTSLITLAVTLVSWVTYSVMSAAVVKLGSQAYLGEEPDVAMTVRQVLPRVPAIMIAGLLKVPLFFIGLLCLLVGVLYVIARWFAVESVIVLEGKGPVEAFGRSTELSRGRKRHILNTLMLVGLIYFILSIGVSAFAVLFKSTVLALVISTAFTIVAFPVIGLTEMLLYYDMRIRGEGFDLEQMAGALDAPALPQR
jgi:hypothetical protein